MVFRWDRFTSGLLTVLILGLGGSGLGGCALSGPVTVTLDYELPAEIGMPEGATRVAVVPIESKVGIDPRWTESAIRLIEQRLESAGRGSEGGVRVVDRIRTRELFDAAKLTADDILTGMGAAEARALPAHAYLIARAGVRSKRRNEPIDDDVIVHQTIEGRAEFILTDVRTGKVWTRFDDTTEVTERTQPPGFLGLGGRTELSTERDVMRRFLIDATGEFVGRMVPVRVRCSIEVESSMNGNCAQGVQYMKERYFPAALIEFEKAVAADPDDHRAMFAAGVAFEAMNRRAQAMDFYQQACQIQPEPKYVENRDRLTREMVRSKPPRQEPRRRPS